MRRVSSAASDWATKAGVTKSSSDMWNEITFEASEVFITNYVWFSWISKLWLHLIEGSSQHSKKFQI